MTFGGDWSDEKLDALGKYLSAYTTALKKTTPFSPPSGPAQTLFQWLPAKSKFLAAKTGNVLEGS
jgi:hypothetical protein